MRTQLTEFQPTRTPQPNYQTLTNAQARPLAHSRKPETRVGPRLQVILRPPLTAPPIVVSRPALRRGPLPRS